jgi:hypothetical protein
MAKTGGGLRKSTTGGIGRDGGGNYSGGISKVGSLREIEDKQLRKEIQQGISKFESRLGVRQRNVKLADLKGAVGVHVTSGEGKSQAVYLNRKIFEKGDIKTIKQIKERAYKSNFLVKTNKPTQHTVVHELAHATWNSNLTGKKQKDAGKEINSLYKQFLKDNPKSWGSYSKSKLNEFYAEGITKAVLGKSDKYTKALIRITKKYEL